MSSLELGVAVVFVLVLLVACVAPAGAVVYVPGVSVGQWVKYGNFLSVGNLEFNQTLEMKFEVTVVSGKNVTLQQTGRYKNNTDMTEHWYTANVETGLVDHVGGLMWVIAGNLYQSDFLTLGGQFRINRTEARGYMGVSRSVNIASVTSGPYEQTFVWDRASGMLMEYKYYVPSLKLSFVAVDTNIFVTGAVGWFMENLIYILIPLVVVVIIVIVAVIFFIRRRKPPPPPPPPPSVETPPPPEPPEKPS
jgi:hypothetical protein